MNKKFFSLGLILLLAIGSVSAVLVTYLSNTAEVNVQVDSPILLGVSNTEVGMDGNCDFTAALNPGPLMLSDIKALETATYFIQVDVQADEDPNDVLQTAVINWSMTNGNGNPTCDDISNITLRVKDLNTCDVWMGPIKDTAVGAGCTCYGDHCDIVVDVDYVPGDKEQYELNLTFANILPDDYSFEHTIQLS